VVVSSVVQCFSVICSRDASGTQGSRIPYGKPVVFRKPVETGETKKKRDKDNYTIVMWNVWFWLIYHFACWKWRNKHWNIVLGSYLLFLALLLSLCSLYRSLFVNKADEYFRPCVWEFLKLHCLFNSQNKSEHLSERECSNPAEK